MNLTKFIYKFFVLCSLVSFSTLMQAAPFVDPWEQFETKLEEEVEDSEIGKRAVEILKKTRDSLIVSASSIYHGDIKFRPVATLVQTKTTANGVSEITNSYEYTLEIECPDNEVEDDLNRQVSRLQSNLAIPLDSESTLNYTIFIDHRNGTFVANPIDSLLGKIPNTKEYKEELNNVLNKALETPGKHRFVIYTYYEPLQTGKIQRSKCAYVLFIEELQWLVGITLPLEAIYPISDMIDDQQRVQAIEQNRLIQTLLTALIFISLLALSFLYLKLRNKSSDLAKRNEDLELYLTAADNASSFIALIDDQNIIRWINKAFRETLNQSKQSQAVNENFLKFTNCEDKEWLRGEIDKRRNGQDKSKVSYYSSLGKKRTLSVLNFFSDTLLNKNWMVLVDTDIEEVIEQKERLEIITNILGHSLASNILALNLSIDQLDRAWEKQDDRRVERNIESLCSQKSKLELLSRNLSRIALLHTKANNSKCWVRDVTEEILEIYQQEAVTRNIIFQTELDPYSGLVQTERENLLLILENLVFNALKYTGGKSASKVVKIISKELAEHVKISVIDQGVGIPEKIKSSLFEQPVNSQGEGKGIGLYLCKRLLSLINGNICIDSNYVEGTKIDVLLPKLPV